MSRTRTGAAAVAGVFLLAGCGGGAGVPDSELLTGADETFAQSADALTGSYPVGTTLATTADLNLRSGPGTNHRVLHVIPKGAHVKTVNRTSPSNGWYNIRHDGVDGWSYGNYLVFVSRPSSGTPGGASGGTSSPTARERGLARAREGVGFSYWWGHGRWLSSGPSGSTRGACYGNCPSCSHRGGYGADCSGYVAKIWDVPASNSSLSHDWHPYSTWNFKNQNLSWHGVTRSTMKQGDALVYDYNHEGHVFVFDRGDRWGWLWAYEAKGCSYGIVHDLRTASSAYRSIARDGW